MTSHNLESISQNSFRIMLLAARLFGNKVAPTLIPVNLNNL